MTKRTFLFLFAASLFQKKSFTISKILLQIKGKNLELVESNDDRAKVKNLYKIADRSREQGKIYFVDKPNFHFVELPLNQEVNFYDSILEIFLEKIFYVFRVL